MQLQLDHPKEADQQCWRAHLLHFSLCIYSRSLLFFLSWIGNNNSYSRVAICFALFFKLPPGEPASNDDHTFVLADTLSSPQISQPISSFDDRYMCAVIGKHTASFSPLASLPASLSVPSWPIPIYCYLASSIRPLTRPGGNQD